MTSAASSLPAPPLTVRRAVEVADLEGARAVTLRTLADDLEYGYEPRWHWDLDRLRETYVENPRQAMFVAVTATGEVVATAAVRVGGPASPPHPAGLAERYVDRDTVAQILRVATRAPWRRRGLARQLVAACQDFVRADGRYRTLCLHTNVKVPGAEAFWRSLPTTLVHDARGDDADRRFETLHFEIGLHEPILGDSSAQPDWLRWVRRWDRQQEGYLPDREAQFTLMFDAIAHLGAAPGQLLDLACGPGSLAARALARFPGAHVTGIDVDPLLLALARRTVAGAAFVDADLRAEGWDDVLGAQEFDAVCSATSLHWLDAEHVERLAETLARRIRRGGVFANLDALLIEPEHPRLAALGRELRTGPAAESHAAGVETWDQWWSAVSGTHAFAPLLTERARRFGPRRHGDGTTLAFHVEALRKAGFVEVDTIAQRGDRRLLIAIR